MLNGYPQGSSRYTDPDESLAGKCLTCGTIVGCLRRDAVSRRGVQDLGAWGDLLSTECPGTVKGKLCGARVFLMSAVNFQKITDRGVNV